MGGWMDASLISPVTDYKAPSFMTLKHLCYIKISDKSLFPTSFSSDATRVSKYYKEYDPTYSKLPDCPSHGYVKSTWPAIEKQFKMFDHPQKYYDDLEKSFPSHFLDLAFRVICDQLKVHEFQYRMLGFEEIVWNKSSSTGYGFTSVNRTKGDYLLNNRSDIDNYWLFAHEDCYDPPLWKVSGKEEYLKFSKIDAGDQRCFEIPNVLFLTYALRMTQHFNKQFTAFADKIECGVGVAYQHGGFDNLVSNFSSGYQYFGQADCSKWDKRYHSKLREYALRMRLMFGPQDRDFKTRLNWVYKNLTNARCVLPWGQVVLVQNGMLSGDPTTTYDNSIAHLLVFTAFRIQLFETTSYRTLVDNCRFLCYADDCVYAIKSGYERYFEFNRMAKWYSECGLLLKQDDTFVSPNLEDLTFLGAKIKLFGNVYVPVYDKNRLLSAVVYSNYRNADDIDIQYQRIYALTILSTFTDIFGFMTQYLSWFYRKFQPKHLNDFMVSNLVATVILKNSSYIPPVPSRDFCIRFWTGNECEPIMPEPLIIGGNKMKNVRRDAQKAKQLAKSEVKVVDKIVKSVSEKSHGHVKEEKKEKKRKFEGPRKVRAHGGPRVRKPAKRAKKIGPGPSNREHMPTSIAQITPEKSYKGDFERYSLSINSYAQTLLHPFTVQGVRRPDGDNATCVWSMRFRNQYNTDSNGNLFISLGVGPGYASGVPAEASRDNQSSLCPNRFRGFRQDGTTQQDYDYQLGIVSPPPSDQVMFDVNDVYKNGGFKPIFLRNAAEATDPPPFFGFVDQYRLISAGGTLQSIGAVVEQKGEMICGWIPYDYFQAGQIIQGPVDTNKVSAQEFLQMPGSALISLNTIRGGNVIWRPTDLLNDEFIPIADEGNPVFLDKNPQYAVGGMFFLVRGAPANTVFDLDVVFNYEGLPKSYDFAPGLSSTINDPIAISAAENLLSADPKTGRVGNLSAMKPEYVGNVMVIHNSHVVHQVPGTAKFNNSHPDGISVRHNLSAIKYGLNGNLRSKIGGFMKGVGEKIPMITRYMTEWAPFAAKLALGIGAML